MTLDELRAEGRTIWKAMPDEVRRLEASRGMLRPIGLLAYAEAEARIFTELVANLVLRVRANELPSETTSSPVVEWMLSRLRDHFRGWYDLPGAAEFLSHALSFLRDARGEDALACLEEIALYLTRLDMWLDLLIPWNDLNGAMLAAEANAHQRASPAAGRGGEQ